MKLFVFVLAGAFLVMGLAGCESISKPYVMQTDRVDQRLDAGNMGYLKGTPPPPKDRGDLKRPLIAVDIDLVDVKTSDKPAQETAPVVETRRETTYTQEETPTMVKRKVTVREEEVK